MRHFYRLLQKLTLWFNEFRLRRLLERIEGKMSSLKMGMRELSN